MFLVNRRSSPWTALLVLGGMVCAGRVAAQNPGPPVAGIEDLFSVSELNEPQLSPDGRTVVYTLHAIDLADNSSNVELWRVSVAGGSPVRLTHNPLDDRHPRWHPRRAEIAFLSARAPDESRAALYTMNPLSGQARRLHLHATSIEAFEWSPDGSSWIAFTAADEPPQQTTVPPGRTVFLEDSAETYVQLWLLNTATGASRPLTRGRERTVQSFAWSPDGRSIAFSATPTNLEKDWQGDIYVVQAHNSAAVPRRITSGPGSKFSPAWAPDGRHLVYAGSAGGDITHGYTRLFQVPASGGPAEEISPRLDIEAEEFAFAAEGGGLFLEAYTGTTREVFYMPLDTRVPVRLTSGTGVSRAAHLSRDGLPAVFLHESPQVPVEVYTAPLPRPLEAGSLAQARRLTSHNQHAARFAVGKTEVIHWNSDGREVEGLLVHRSGPVRPGPLVVNIHGGPADSWVQNFQAAGPWAMAQVFAADGYAVLLPNPRGSHGYGDAARQMADWGQLAYQDVISGVDAVIELGLAHSDSLAVMGWSYGGFMTAWTITRTQRFKAAVVGAGITEPISMWGMQNGVLYFEAYFGGSPFAEGAWEKYQRSSPLLRAPCVRTPTLIIHGTDDPTVPPGQARFFYRALRANGVHTELVWLPGTEHGPTTPGLQFELVRRQKEWIDRGVHGQHPAPASLPPHCSASSPTP